MKDYGKILEHFYFEIFGEHRERLREAQKKLMAFPTGAPGSYGIWYFDGVKYEGEENGTHTWTCYMKNLAHKQYVDFIPGPEDPRNVKLGMNPKMARRVRLKVDPLKDGVHKWRIDYGDHTLTIGGNSDIIATYDNRDYRWTMELRDLHLDYNLQNIEYLDRDPASVKKKPVNFIINEHVKTGNNITVNSESGVTISKENSFEYGFKETLAVGATVKAKVNAPFGSAEFSAELRVDASLEATRKNSITETITYYSNNTINIGENTEASIKVTIDWEDNGAWPFDAFFHIRGLAARADGNTEADTMTTEEVELVLKEKGFTGTFLDAKSPVTANAKINGLMTGAFGMAQEILALDTDSED